MREFVLSRSERADFLPSQYADVSDSEDKDDKLKLAELLEHFIGVWGNHLTFVKERHMAGASLREMAGLLKEVQVIVRCAKAAEREVGKGSWALQKGRGGKSGGRRS